MNKIVVGKSIDEYLPKVPLKVIEIINERLKTKKIENLTDTKNGVIFEVSELVDIWNQSLDKPKQYQARNISLSIRKYYTDLGWEILHVGSYKLIFVVK